MDTIESFKYAAMEAGRKYLEQCARLNGKTAGEFVDNMLACDAVGCDDVRSVVVELSVQVAFATPLDVDIPDEQLIQWCCDVEDEFRTRPRPTRCPTRIGNACLRENVCLLREE